MNSDLTSHILNWLSLVGIKNESETQILDTRIKDINGLDSLVTMSLISEIETFQTKPINDELLFLMKNFTLREFLHETTH